MWQWVVGLARPPESVLLFSSPTTPRLSVRARALQGSASRGPSSGLRVQSEALFSLLYCTRLLRAIDMWMSKGCPRLCVLCVLMDLLGSVAHVACCLSNGTSVCWEPKGKKTMAPYVGYPSPRIYRSATHTPPLILPPLLHPQPTVSSLQS